MGTVFQKLERVQQTKEDLKTVINYGGEKITNATVFNDYAEKLKDVYIDAINDGTDIVYDNFPKETENGGNIVLDTESGPMKITLKSDISQTVLLGTNLFNPIINNDGTDIYTSNCNAILDSDNETLKLTATATGNIGFGAGRASGGNYSKDRGWLMEIQPSTNYSFNVIGSEISRIYFNAYDENEISLGGTSVYGNSGTYMTPSTAKYITASIMINGINGTIYNVKMIIAKGENIPTYEKYNGNTQFPNPDTPENVKIVTGNNSIVIDGENLFDDDISNLKYSTVNNTLSQIENGIRATFTGSSSETYRYASLSISNSQNLLGKKCTLRCNISQSNPNVAAVRIYQITSTGKATSNTAIITANTIGENIVSFNFPNSFHSNAVGFGIFFYSNSTGTVAQNDYVDYTNIKLISTPYEPYAAQSYSITFSESNLFDKTDEIQNGKTYSIEGEITNLSNASIQESYIPVDSSYAYTISTRNDFSTETDYRLQILEYDEEKNFIKRNQGTRGGGITTQYTVVLGDTTKYIRLGSSTVALDELKFEKGTPIEYGKIKNYEDCFFKNTPDNELYDSNLVEGDWYLKKVIGKNILGEGQTWAKSVIAANNNTWRYSCANNNKHLIDIGYANLFIVKTENISVYDDIEMIQLSTSNSNKYIGVHIKKTRLASSDVEDFVSWISSNNIILYYVLYTPTYIHITETNYPTLLPQLENLYNNTKSYDKKTCIIVTSENENAQLKVAATALKNINTIESEWED